MATFDKLYSQYYDLIYREKPYAEEGRFVSQLLTKNSENKVDSILELGCGTGRHMEFWPQPVARYCGVDLSAAMLEIARERFNKQTHSFINQNICQLDLKGQKFSSVISLFHVASYQNSNADFLSFLTGANRALDQGGVFVFDFWYGPAVLRDPPQTKTLKKQDDQIEVIRLTTPEYDFDGNVVNIDFQIAIRSKSTGESIETSEQHSMRYFFLPELKLFAELAGFQMCSAQKWGGDQPLSDKTWYGVVVLKKVKETP